MAKSSKFKGAGSSFILGGLFLAAGVTHLAASLVSSSGANPWYIIAGWFVIGLLYVARGTYLVSQSRANPTQPEAVQLQPTSGALGE
ncbi:hypothetical protein I6A60_00150 [Frankia sp. AgB1.9]|uniref:hypothetical protein n=1 Tax=unclassified Frankia TaxID=2632575 RepID=UPI0019319029|nr:MULTISPECIES: hypothetical protein [unclassified Frankia]MBL7487291.1 hypothetical protein [Frankia sp. AgW1.1]MBL7546298.1 hypothetical protein [Frankia sp. AgB1.9]MBL7618657.1 hypothetical protein [Frankia sp. AgB1.8]